MIKIQFTIKNTTNDFLFKSSLKSQKHYLNLSVNIKS